MVFRALASLIIAVALPSSMFAAVGPEQLLPARFVELRALAAGGTDFLIAYQALSGSRGLYVQRIGRDGALIGGPIEISSALRAAFSSIAFDGTDFLIAYRTTTGAYVQRLSREGLAAPPMQITAVSEQYVGLVSSGGATAALWRDCSQRPSCALMIRWLDGQGEPSVLQENVRDFSMTASPLRDGALFVAWRDSSLQSDHVYLSKVERHATAFSGIDVISSGSPGIDGIALRSNEEEMLIGWQQAYVVGYNLMGHSFERHAQVRTLDSSGRPIGHLRNLRSNIWTEPAGRRGFISVGLGWGEADRITRIMHGRVIEEMPHPPGVLRAVAATDREVYSLNLRRTPDDNHNSYLTVMAHGRDATYTLTRDPGFDENNLSIIAGGDRLLVAYISEPRDRAVVWTRQITYRIVDPHTLPPPAPPPAAPRVVAASESFPAEVSLQWESVPGAVAYRVIQSVTDDPYKTIEYVFGKDRTTATLKLSSPETPYAFQLVVEDATGLSDRSEPVMFRTGTAGWARAPLNVTASVGSGRTVTLRWDDVSSNEDGFKIIWGWGMETLLTVPADTTEATVQLPRAYWNVFPLHVVAFRGNGESYSAQVVVEVGDQPARRRATGR